MSSNKLSARAVPIIFVPIICLRMILKYSKRITVAMTQLLNALLSLKMHFFDENAFFFLTISPTTLDSYPSLPTQDESVTRRIEDSLPLQYPSLHLSEAPILDQRTPCHKSETSAPQPTSFTYFPKYYVRQKTLEPTNPSSTECNSAEPVNQHLSEHSRQENLSLVPFANLVVGVSSPTHILFHVF